MSLGEVQTEEGHTEDAVETYLQVLGLQLESVDEDPPDPFEVANAHVQASTVHIRRWFMMPVCARQQYRQYTGHRHCWVYYRYCHQYSGLQSCQGI